MADISGLGVLSPVEPIDMDLYPESKGFSLPAAGQYIVQAPDNFPPAAFTRTKAGSLSVQIDPKIVGPTNEGHQLRFVKVSAKVFRRGNLPASQLGDYLKACGVSGKFTDEQQLADAIDQTANKSYQVELDWRAYYKDGFSLEGMKRFPSDGNGGHQSWVQHPTALDDEGKPVRCRANLIVRRFIPAGE
jgi:hypothetical protein